MPTGGISPGAFLPHWSGSSAREAPRDRYSSPSPRPRTCVVLDVRRADTSATIVATGEIDSSVGSGVPADPGSAAPRARDDRGRRRPRGHHVPRLRGPLRAGGRPPQTKSTGVQLRVLASSRAVIRPLQITGLWDLLRVEQGAAPTGVASSIATIPVQS